MKHKDICSNTYERIHATGYACRRRYLCTTAEPISWCAKAQTRSHVSSRPFRYAGDLNGLYNHFLLSLLRRLLLRRFRWLGQQVAALVPRFSLPSGGEQLAQLEAWEGVSFGVEYDLVER